MEEIGKIKLFPPKRYEGKLCFDGCKLCNGCRELVKDWDVFPQECKVREKIMYNIEERLFPQLKIMKVMGAELYKQHIISEINAFKNNILKNQPQIKTLDKWIEKVYWCSVNYVFWCDAKSIEVLNEELKKAK